MDTSVAKEYLPTIINSRSLLTRLMVELRGLHQDVRSAWPEFRKHPFESIVKSSRSLFKRSGVLFAPNVIAAFAIVLVILASALLVDRARHKIHDNTNNVVIAELTILNLHQ